MPDCSLFGLLCLSQKVARPTHALESSNRTQKNKTNKSALIAIRTEGQSQACIWRVAVLSCNPGFDLDAITQSLITKLLHVRTESIDKDTIPPVRDNIDIGEVEEFLDLV